MKGYALGSTVKDKYLDTFGVILTVDCMIDGCIRYVVQPDPKSKVANPNGDRVFSLPFPD